MDESSVDASVSSSAKMMDRRAGTSAKSIEK